MKLHQFPHVFLRMIWESAISRDINPSVARPYVATVMSAIHKSVRGLDRVTARIVMAERAEFQAQLKEKYAETEKDKALASALRKYIGILLLKK